MALIFVSLAIKQDPCLHYKTTDTALVHHTLCFITGGGMHNNVIA